MINFKTVHIYTGDRWTQEDQNWPTELVLGEVQWDEGGVRIRREDSVGAQVWQVPWSAVKYVTWREDGQAQERCK